MILEKEIYPFYYNEIKYNTPISFIKSMSSSDNNERYNISIMPLNLLKNHSIINKNLSFNQKQTKIIDYVLRVKYSQPFQNIDEDINNLKEEYLLNILLKIKKDKDVLSPVKNLFLKENKNFKTKIINRHKIKIFDQYIGRGTPFGNPHSHIANDYIKNKEESLNAYKYDFYKKISEDKKFKLLVLRLRGKTLACSCKPADCHGDIIVEYLDSIADIESEILKTKKRV